MKTTKRLRRSESRGKDQSPVVITFDERGRVMDVVGDVRQFVGVDDTAEQMLLRMYDLLIGDGSITETLSAVEVSTDRYADIHVLAEGSLRHLVLLDASEVMQVLRVRQQKENEALLEHRALHRQLKTSLRLADSSEIYEESGVSFRSSSLLGSVIREMRSPVALMSGHVRFLAGHLEHDAVSMRSVAAIRGALVRLEALSTAGLQGAIESSNGQGEEQGSLHELAIYLQDAFQLQAELRGIEFEVHVAERSVPVAVDFNAVRHVLMGLVVHALDGLDQKRLVVSLLHHDKGMDVELETSPVGFPAVLFGALLTTRDLLYSNPSASLPLAISQQLMNNLSATIELVPAQAGGYVLWFRIPLQRR
ncbi:sensor histidine kinase [Lysobacter terrae]